jgi:hypothetical protein
VPERIGERCKIRNEEKYMLDIITVGWADPALLSVFGETMMDPKDSFLGFLLT